MICFYHVKNIIEIISVVWHVTIESFPHYMRISFKYLLSSNNIKTVIKKSILYFVAFCFVNCYFVLLISNNVLLIANNNLLIANNVLLIANNNLLITNNVLLIANNLLLIATNVLLIANNLLLIANNVLLIAMFF